MTLSPPAITARTAILRRAHWFGDPAAITVVALLTILATVLVPFATPPREDAAMLMRYAEHLAAGAGLTWNVGQAPVDGATDFLFTVAVAGLHASGLEIVTATRVLILASWFLTIAIVYWAARRMAGASPILATIAVLPIILGTARYYVAAGFGAPFFGLWTALTAVAALSLAAEPGVRRSLLLGASALLLGLTRPEGVILAVLIAAGVVVHVGWRRALRSLAPGALLFIAAGALYFAWRWTYFGYPLPNPFYKKGGGTIHLDGLVDALRAVERFGMPFLLLWVPAIIRGPRRQAVALALPIAGFTLIWALLSSEMNWMWRFQYPIAVLVAIYWPVLLRDVRAAWPAIAGLADRLSRPRVVGACLVLLLAAGAVVLPLTSGRAEAALPDPRNAIGTALAPFRDRGHTVVTTEAGLIPLRSGWTALDPWGLNDQTIAHRGYLTPSDLDAANPTVIFAHLNPAGAAADAPQFERDWARMTGTITTWIAGNPRYELVRSTADADGWVWNTWIDSTGADAAALRAALVCTTPPQVTSSVGLGSCAS